MNENKEIWKDIKGFEGHYQVSNLGRVKSIKFRKERILKPGRDKDGYLIVCLHKNKQQKTYKVHRIVAQAFLLNLDNHKEVNHKNEDKTDNKVKNLEWCYGKYNLNYGTRNQRIAEKMTNGKLSKPVIQFTKSGEFIQEWKSVMDIERYLGYSHSCISKCCRGKYKLSYGFIWKYKN